MTANGRDCAIVIKTVSIEKNIPFASETIREAFSFLQEEAAIEGNGACRGIRKSAGITGCVVAPLSIETAPLLLYLALGAADAPVLVSGTRNRYKYELHLLPMENSGRFDLIQDRNRERRLFENCRVRGFELRLGREEAVHLKLDIAGEFAPALYPYAEFPATETGERFSGDCVTCRINGTEYQNIYGLTLSAHKAGGATTELWIKRALQQGADLPELIEELTITAQQPRSAYEPRQFGIFRVTVTRLVLIADETAVDCADALIGPLRYYAAGTVNAEVLSASPEALE
jgi:hypothetical protein